MEAASNATASIPGCPATSPLLVFLTAVLTSIMREENQQRQQQAQSDPGVAGEYDYVVVGGGSAGCVLAARLSEDANAAVLLLERGGREPPEARVPAYTLNNMFSDAIVEHLYAQPEPQNCNATGCLLNVPRVLGGGSTINGMLYVRGSPEGYDRWAELTGDARWTYRNVLPYFKKSEDNLDPAINSDTTYHAVGGPLKVSWQRYRHPVIPLVEQAFQDQGVQHRLDMNANGQLGYSVGQTTQAGGERWSTYRSYVEPVEASRPNLRVETFATARRVLLQSKSFVLQGPGAWPRAVGVEFVDAAGKEHVVRARREVVLSAGALHTPQLLMLSGIGPAKQLKALGIPVVRDLPVGAQLLDHPDVPGVQYTCGPPLCVTDWPSRQRDLLEYNATRTGPLSAFSVLQFMAFNRTSRALPGTGSIPDLQSFFLGNTVTEEETCMQFDGWRMNRLTAWASLMQPLSRGSVRLNATDPRGPPVVRLGYLSAERDVEAAVEGLRHMLALNESLAARGLALDLSFVPECDAHAFASDAYLRCVSTARTQTSWHWAGTCPMGRPWDRTAVLDSRLRVRGVRALRVADASAMPALPSGNTNAPTIMLAELAADLVKQDAAAAHHNY